MRTQHFVDDPTFVLSQSLAAIPFTNPWTVLDLPNKTLYSPIHQASQRVTIVSGGGAGHEPSFTGYVGPGFLSSAVSGTIFASPSSRQVLTALERELDRKADIKDGGVVVMVMNYTGDVLNFGVAVEKIKARRPDARVEMLVVGDDVGVPRSNAGKVGRRGIAGTVLVMKILGAMAQKGYGMDDILRVGGSLGGHLVSLGASLERVHVPGTKLVPRLQTAEAADIELGMGIHNETGSAKLTGTDAAIGNLVKKMLTQLLSKEDADRNFLTSHSDQMVLLINNLGSLSVLELGAIASIVRQALHDNFGKSLIRIYCGTFMTSLNGPGFSISLLNVHDLEISNTMIELLDAQTDVPGWHAVSQNIAETSQTSTIRTRSHSLQSESGHRSLDLTCDMNVVEARLRVGLEAVIEAEPDITRFDDVVGDGDCGTTLKRGAEEIQKSLEMKPASIVELLSYVTTAVEESMDGTPGAIYSIFVNALVHYFKQDAPPHSEVNVAVWANALQHALNALTKYTAARKGDRTLMDVLIPFIETLSSSSDLQQAAEAAEKGAQRTKFLMPNLGRSVYIGSQEDWLGKIPDPGAWGLSKFLNGLATS